MNLQDLFRDLAKRHSEATNVGDLNAIEKMVPEYENLLNHAPNETVILFGIGTCKLQLGHNGSAISYFERALANGELPEIWNNLGSAWKAENNNEKARECWEKALDLREDADYYNNLATLYVNEGNPEGGMPYAEKGLELNPNHPRIHWNYSLLLLEQGRWAEGFEHYDYGLVSKDRPNRMYDSKDKKVPFWTGQKGKVVVYGEQGMGDEIMFASCIPDLIDEVGKDNVIFDCHPRMIRLFERSFGVKCYGTRKDSEIAWPLEDPVDYKVAIGSLFGRYRKNGHFPKTPYLLPDPELVENYQKRLKDAGDGPYIGVGWAGGHKKTNAHYRSLKISKYTPIFEQGGTFISLQYTEGAEGKCQRFFENTGIKVHHWADVIEAGPDGDRYSGMNYDHTAALVSCLDLCILPNTTAVHLCGALGVECWTMTPEASAWRYQLTGDDMPMYGPWVRQFRKHLPVEEYREWLCA